MSNWTLKQNVEGKLQHYSAKHMKGQALLTPTLENIRIWVENKRMKPDEVEDSVRESCELAQTFQTIGDLLKNEFLRECQQILHSDGD
nr:hypothetical protein [uncultured Oscillibacter sp.]